jgi:hypothetical protein
MAWVTMQPHESGQAANVAMVSSHSACQREIASRGKSNSQADGLAVTLYLAGMKRYCCRKVSTVEYFWATSTLTGSIKQARCSLATLLVIVALKSCVLRSCTCNMFQCQDQHLVRQSPVRHGLIASWQRSVCTSQGGSCLLAAVPACLLRPCDVPML